MAVLPSKNSGKAKQHASGVRFRQRKISVKQPLAIFKQKDLPSLDNSNELEPSQIHHLSANGQQQRDVHAIETGVDKNEEDEVHLQQVINAAQKALLGSKKSDNKKDLTKEHSQSVYIPTPDASKLWPDAHKFYNDQVFREPESYIKFSATVEDTVGVEFNMDEEDELFLNNVLNKSYPKVKKGKQEPGDINTRKCSDSEFEMVCDRLEKTIEERQPFLSMDPTNILSYQELSSYILVEFKSSNKTSPHVQSGSNLKYLTTTTLKEKLANELNYEVFATVFDKNPLDQSSTTSSTQPYVKLPPSKIPDMDLVTVSLVLKEKNETIKRAVLEKLRKRKEQDKGFMNVTDDPYQPYFNISTNKDGKELNHIPYSSIAAANFHQINITNYLSDSLKKLLEDGKKSLPGMKTFRGSNGELIPSKAFPHLSSTNYPSKVVVVSTFPR